MTPQQIAALYAMQIKGGEMSKTNAIMYYRARHRVTYIDALESIDIAIGNFNEFGECWEILTEIDPFGTL